MFSNYSPAATLQNNIDNLTPLEEDPFTVYARSLHEYTLHLWTESIRTTQEKKQRHMAAKAERRVAAQKKRQREATQKVQGTSVDEEKGVVKSSM